MKDFKGIYHNINDTAKYYEFGALFKYQDLYNALKDLQKEKNVDIPLNDESPIKIQNTDEKENTKNRKKYKLKSINFKNNVRYSILNTDINNNIQKIEEENENIITRKKRSKLLTKSLDKVKLPKINIKNTNNNIPINNQILVPIKLDDEKNDINNYQFKKLNKSLDMNKKNLVKKNEEFPKINSLYHYEITQENKNNEIIVEETQSRFKDTNESINIFNNLEEKKLNKRGNNLKKMSYRLFEKISDLDEGKENNLELLSKPNIKSNRLKSIFEKEKEIKKYNLFLGKMNNYSSNNRNVKREEISQQIHNLKKQLLIKYT